MNNVIRIIVISGAVVGMGFSMPSCPGQQAMQQQVDALTAKSSEMNKDVQSLTTKSDQANTELTKLNALVAQLNTEMTEQKQKMEQIEVSIKALNDKLTAPKAPQKSAKSMPKKRGH